MAGNTRKTTFDAGQFGSLRYDFTAFGGVTGIIPDPSDVVLEKFNDDYRVLLEKYGVSADDDEVDTNDPQAVQDALEKSKGTSFVEQQRDMIQLIADLCSGSPTMDEILRLPFRVRQRFIIWVQQQLVNPEA